MNSLPLSRKLTHFLAAGIACISFAVAVNAQVQTRHTTSHGPASKIVNVDRGEVVYVSGNDLVIKRDDGRIEHFRNVSHPVTVDGKQVRIHDLKPGMKLERTITTTTTPRTITTVQTVTGKVWHVNPPRFVILTMEDGTNHQFDLPEDHRVMVDGQETDAWSLKKGMKISATRVIESPETVVTQHTKLTASGAQPEETVSAPPPTIPPADQPIFFVFVRVPAPISPVLAEATPTTLPKTGSLLPLLGLFGVLALGSSLGLGITRKMRQAKP
jgi:hypothetical protein